MKKINRTRRKALAAALALSTLLGVTSPASAALDYQNDWLLHTGTALGTTTASHVRFVGMDDYNKDGFDDLFVVITKGTGTKKTELHVLNGANNYHNFLLQTGTGLGMVGDEFEFAVGDYNNDGKLDLYCLKKHNCGSKRLEVHVLDGGNGYQTFLQQTGTALEESTNQFDFHLADCNNDGKLDLYCIKKQGGSGKVEVHILNGAANFNNFLVHAATALHSVGDEFQFLVDDYNNDSRPDLLALKTSGTSSGKTEYHLMLGANNFAAFGLQAATQLHQCDESVQFLAGDLGSSHAAFAVMPVNTGTNTTELHAMAVSSKATASTGSSSSPAVSNGLHSPVPAGCYFNKKTSDSGVVIYHDINVGVSTNTPVYAIADGTVTFKQAYKVDSSGQRRLTSYGNYVEFTSADGTITVKYAHLDRFAGVQQSIPSSSTWRVSGSNKPLVLGTRQVKAGDILGYIGSTGNSSGNHLHIEVRVNGVRVDPTTLFPGLVR